MVVGRNQGDREDGSAIVLLLGEITAGARRPTAWAAGGRALVLGAQVGGWGDGWLDEAPLELSICRAAIEYAAKSLRSAISFTCFGNIN